MLGSAAGSQILRLPLTSFVARHCSTKSPIRWMRPKKEVLPWNEGAKVRDEAESLAVWGPRSYWDAITREELSAELTRPARQEELDFMQDWHVWDVAPVAESWSVVGKAPLQGKWVDVNKGDFEKPSGSLQVCERIRER